jgi:hypothetical protein
MTRSPICDGDRIEAARSDSKHTTTAHPEGSAWRRPSSSFRPPPWNARLERAAASNREQAEGERAGNERAQREAIEQERAIVTNSIGIGLTKLAAKDLTFRMSYDIPDAYRKLQTNFNAAIEQLEGANAERRRQRRCDPGWHAGDIDSVFGRSAASSSTSIDRRQASSCESLISPR